MAAKHDKKESLRTAWNIITSGAEWPFVAEFRFHPVRRWRFDWADPPRKIAVEVEGITHYGPAIGRHQSASGIEGDMEKYNAAIVIGWAVLRYSQRMIKDDPHSIIQQILEVADKRRVMPLPVVQSSDPERRVEVGET